MINLPRYQEKGILLSYLLNRDVSDIIIQYLKVAEQVSEVTFRESNQELFRREYDWDIPMREYMDKLSMNYIQDHVDDYYGYNHIALIHLYHVHVSSYPNWAVSRRVREAVTDTCRDLAKLTEDRKLTKGRKTAKKRELTRFEEKAVYNPVTKRNNRKEIARSNRVMKKHMKNR